MELSDRRKDTVASNYLCLLEITDNLKSGKMVFSKLLDRDHIKKIIFGLRRTGGLIKS